MSSSYIWTWTHCGSTAEERRSATPTADRTPTDASQTKNSGSQPLSAPTLGADRSPRTSETARPAVGQSAKRAWKRAVCARREQCQPADCTVHQSPSGQPCAGRRLSHRLVDHKEDLEDMTRASDAISLTVRLVGGIFP